MANRVCSFMLYIYTTNLYKDSANRAPKQQVHLIALAEMPPILYKDTQNPLYHKAITPKLSAIITTLHVK